MLFYPADQCQEAVPSPLRPPDSDMHQRAAEALAFMTQGFGFPGPGHT